MRRTRGLVWRVGKWAGAITCSLLLMLWALTTPFWLSRWFRDGGSLRIRAGVITRAWWSGSPAAVHKHAREFQRNNPNPDKWEILRPAAGYSYWGWAQLGFVLPKTVTLQVDKTLWISAMQFPVWIPCALLAVPTALLWYGDRRFRIRSGHCAKCGYDLTLNVSGKCPECGVRIEGQSTVTTSTITIGDERS